MCHLPGPTPAEGWPMFITQLQTWTAWALCGWQTTKISWLDFSSSVCQLGLAGIPWAQRLLASLGLFCNSQQSDKTFEGTTHTFSSGEAIYILRCHDLKKKKKIRMFSNVVIFPTGIVVVLLVFLIITTFYLSCRICRQKLADKYFNFFQNIK